MAKEEVSLRVRAVMYGMRMGTVTGNASTAVIFIRESPELVLGSAGGVFTTGPGCDLKWLFITKEAPWPGPIGALGKRAAIARMGNPAGRAIRPLMMGPA